MIGMGLSAALREFLAYYRMEVGASDNTLAAYGADLADLIRFLSFGGIVEVHRVELSHLEAWLKYLSVRGFATSSIARKMAAVRMFWRYLVETRGVRNLGAMLDSVKREQKVPMVPRAEQVADMLQTIRRRVRMCWRDRAIIELFFGAGLRASELIGIRIIDVDLRAKNIRVIGKGNKERIVLFGEPARVAVERYLADVRPKLVRHVTPLLFVSRTGRPLDRFNIFRLVDKLGKRAGIPARVTPHGLRHAFATSLHAGGADLRVIQALLGHESISTTEKYTHMDASRLRAAHAKFHPLENGQIVDPWSDQADADLSRAAAAG